jgi:hypothetical protein
MLTIQIEYRAIPPRRQGHTHAIATALRTLRLTPHDEMGNPGSFTVPKRHRRAVLIAAKDVGAEVSTYAESDGLIRVRLAEPADKTMPLPFAQEGGAKL